MATNYIQEGSTLSVVCTNPSAPDSGDPVRFGSMTGVALTDEGDGGNASTETTVHFAQGVFDLSVKAVDDSGNSAVAVGDSIFYGDADTPTLTKKSSGYFFGFALEAIDAGETATINVLHVPSPGSGTLGSGTVGTTNLAANAVTAAKLAATLDLSSNTITLPKVLTQSTAGYGYPVISPSATVKANASTATVLAADFPKNNTNTGATGAIVLTLPAAADVSGKACRVYVTAAQTITLTPATGEKIYLAGSGVASKYALIAGVIGNYVDLYCDGTDYFITGYSGVVTKEA